jgi:hypothetical protein
MLACDPSIGYIDEPLSMEHRPGILRTPVDSWYPYLTGARADAALRDIARMLAFRYGVGAELAALRSPKDVARLGRDWYRFAALRRRRARPLLKDPHALLSAGLLADAFAMRVVVLVRHPAAFVSSLKRVGWTHDFSHFVRQAGLVAETMPGYADALHEFARRPPGILEQACLLWNVLNSVAVRHRETRPDWLFVRHEDVSLDPLTGFRRLYAELDLHWGADVEAEVRRRTSSGNPAEAEPGVVHQLTRDSAANVFNWRRRLAADEIATVRERTAAVAAAFYSDVDW